MSLRRERSLYLKNNWVYDLSAWKVSRKIPFQFQFRKVVRQVLQWITILIRRTWNLSVPLGDGLVLVLLGTGTIQTKNKSSTDLKAFTSTSCWLERTPYILFFEILISKKNTQGLINAQEWTTLLDGRLENLGILMWIIVVSDLITLNIATNKPGWVKPTKLLYQFKLLRGPLFSIRVGLFKTTGLEEDVKS